MTETTPLCAVREILTAILSETVIYSMPEPADAARPDLPYISLRTLSDRSLATPHKNNSDLGDTGDDPDVLSTRKQQRRALVQCTFWGASAVDRGIQVEDELGSERARSARDLREVTVAVAGAAEDVTGLLGNAWVEAAQLDLWVYYRRAHTEELYSIQEVTCGCDA